MTAIKNFLRKPGILQNTLRKPGILQNTLRKPGIVQNTRRKPGILRILLENQEVYEYSKKIRNFTEYS